MHALGLECTRCGRQYPLNAMYEGCPECMGSGFTANLSVRYDLRSLKKALTRKALEDNRKLGLVRYAELLPIEETVPFITLGAGQTPLLACNGLARRLDMQHVYVKDESRNPTSAFKDRYASIAGNVALHFGLRYLVASGNTGAAAAAFGAAYGLDVVTIEDPRESRATLLQTLSYGGKVLVLEKLEDRYDLTKQFVDQFRCHPLSSYTESPTGDPYCQEGAKTIAYEICEDLGWKAPHCVIVPTGQGLCLYGIWRGFLDFYELGLVETLPRMIAAESSAGGSFSKSVLNKAEPTAIVQPRPTAAAHAVAVRGSYKGLRALSDSGGCALTADDQSITEAAIDLAKTDGIWSGATSATAVAVLRKLREAGRVSREEVVVCVATSGGLKDLDVWSAIPPDKMRLESADLESAHDLLARNYGFKLAGSRKSTSP